MEVVVSAAMVIRNAACPLSVLGTLGTLGGVVGLFSFWTVASLLPGMATLIQFVNLRQDAIDVPDDIDIRPGKPEVVGRQVVQHK
jgi:hypothetical protein